MSNHSYNQNSDAAMHAVNYWQVIKNRYGIIILTFLLVFMTALVITYVMPRKYESSVKLQVRPRVPSLEVMPGAAQAKMSPMSNQFFPTEFEVIQSQKTLDLVIDDLALTNRWGQDREAVRSRLKSIIKVENIRGTDIIEIRVRTDLPEDARLIADRLSAAYRQRRTKLENERMDQALIEMREAVRAQEDLVDEKRKVLTRLIQNERLIYMPGQSGMPGGYRPDESASDAGRRYAELEAQKIMLESQIQTLMGYDGPQLITYAAGLDLPENSIKMLYPQYQQAKRQLEASKLSGLGDNHPTIKAQKEIIDGLKRDLDRGVVALRETLRAKLELVREQSDQMERKKDSEEEDAMEAGIARQSFDDASQEFETAQSFLESLKIKLIGQEMQRKITENPVIVHADPVINQNPVSPNVKMNFALGAVVGLVFGIGIAFFLEYMDTSVKTLEDVERYLQVPVLAVIPKNVGILYQKSGMSPDAEAYRILRTNIEFNRKNPEDNAITVVSGGAGEGKSTTLVNLAYICAQGGYTTLMLDGDLRRPKLHTFFEVNNSVGLTNYLTTDLMLEDVILQTSVDNLYFMPSGILPADAAGILNSRRMSELIQDVKQRFDLVLIDSPPILGVSDASVLASEVDLTMIVVQHRKLPRNMLMRVKTSVENVGGHVIGVVLNNVDIRGDSQYQYYTSYYTYYSPAEVSQQSVNQPGQPATAKTAEANQNEDLY